jgi:hypothetical protein
VDQLRAPPAPSCSNCDALPASSPWNDLLDCCIRLLSGTALRIRPEHLPECARTRNAESGFTSHGEEIIVTGDQDVRASGLGRGEHPTIGAVSDLKGAGLLRLGYDRNPLEYSFSRTNPVRRNLEFSG